MAQPRMKKSVPMKVRKTPKPAVVAGASEQQVVKTPASADNFTFSSGRRKTATARVRVFHGGSSITINNKPAKDYFSSIDPTGTLITRPFIATHTVGSFSCSVKVEGSGIRAQLEASIHGIARALVTIDASHRPALRQAGLLTRDDRMKESRKVGKGGKARKEKQSPKR